MSRFNKKIEVSCKECSVVWLKRTDTMDVWQGRCRSCNTRDRANQTWMKEILKANGIRVTTRFGGVPNAMKFSANPESPRYMGGDKNNNWKGGITTENNRIRSSAAYKEWRKTVFAKDDYRCLYCGERGGKLEADHILPFAYYPRLRLDINNGQTLCTECHKTTPTYKKKMGMELTGMFTNQINLLTNGV